MLGLLFFLFGNKREEILLIEIEFKEPCNDCGFVDMKCEETYSVDDCGDEIINLRIWCGHNYVCSRYLEATKKSTSEELL